MRIAGAPLLTALLPASLAWNRDVHQQIGFLAETFLTPETKAVVSGLLESEYSGSIGRAAAWADSYRGTPEGAYTSTWHYIDPADEPPAYCNVYYNRDCSRTGCVVSALTNQTYILRDCISQTQGGGPQYLNVTNATLTCSNALKFVTHFTGDITQPLHTSAIGIGGNEFDVRYGNRTTNLHSVWDGAILYSAAGVTGFSNSTISPYFSSLRSRIIADTFFQPAAEWLSCIDPSTPTKCAMEWARDANGWTCDYVYSQTFNGTNLLTSGYAEAAYPIVELQVSKAALRLASWLNAIVAGDYNMDREVILRTNPSWLLGPLAGA